MSLEAQERSERMFVTPRIRIVELADAVRVEAELPGVPKEGVDIQVKGDEMTLTGRRRHNGSGAQMVMRERQRCDYRRVFTLSRAVDASKVEAEMHNGLLTLTIPKAEHMKPRQITVN